MTAVIVKAVQGSAEWKEHRAKSFNASEASAMLGMSSHMSRSELLKQKATGVVPDVDPATQRRFDDGHRYEAMARPLAEEVVGEDLFPVTLTLHVDSLPISASMDGLTMLAEVCWEHKTLNTKLEAALDAGEIPEEYWPQMEQQMLVSGAERCLFMASRGDRESMRYQWYEGNPGVRQRLLDGWKQFAEDLASYEPKEVKPEVVAEPQESLPALVVKVSGSLAITDNLDVFGTALTGFVDRLNLEPKTDQDFADLEAATKALKKAEDALTSEEDRALAQADGIEALRRTVNQYRDLARTTRLRAEKVVKAEKENRRNEIRMAALEAFRAHVEQINATFSGRVRLPEIAIDVAGVMKGKRTIASLEDAADTEVARAKIEANRVADEYRKNLAILDAEAKGYEFLFHDTADLVTNSPEHLAGVIQGRIAAHKEAEQLKLESERERIREEEQAKAKAEAAKQAEPMPEKPIHQATDLHRPHGSNAHPAAAAELAPASRPQLTSTRPSDRQIIGTLMHAYGADRATVIVWLAEMDLEEAA